MTTAVNGSVGKTLRKKRRTSVAIFPLSLGGSNAERLEIEAIFSPPYNAARYGVSLTASPYQADVILLYGSLTEKMAEIAYHLLTSMPLDVKLVALGSETLSASPFQNAYAVLGPLIDAANTQPPATREVETTDKVAVEKGDPETKKTKGLPLPPGLHLSGYIAGSPPDPQSILDGILEVAKEL